MAGPVRRFARTVRQWTPQRRAPASKRSWAPGGRASRRCSRARATASPDRRFLRFGEREWTYAEALGEAERFAGYLRASGVAGGRVASYTANRPEAVWAWFGTQLAGGTYVPLNRSHRGPLLADMLRRSGAQVLLTEADAVDEVASHGDVGVTRSLVAGDGGRVEEERLAPYAEVEGADRWEGVTPAPGDLGMVMYTSGSTGRSKAVELTHNQHCRGAAHIAESFGLRPDDVWHGWAPLYHVLGPALRRARHRRRGRLRRAAAALHSLALLGGRGRVRGDGHRRAREHDAARLGAPGQPALAGEPCAARARQRPVRRSP